MLSTMVPGAVEDPDEHVTRSLPSRSLQFSLGCKGTSDKVTGPKRH